MGQTESARLTSGAVQFLRHTGGVVTIRGLLSEVHMPAELLVRCFEFMVGYDPRASIGFQ